MVSLSWLLHLSLFSTEGAEGCVALWWEIGFNTTVQSMEKDCHSEIILFLKYLAAYIYVLTRLLAHLPS